MVIHLEHDGSLLQLVLLTVNQQLQNSGSALIGFLAEHRGQRSRLTAYKRTSKTICRTKSSVRAGIQV